MFFKKSTQIDVYLLAGFFFFFFKQENVLLSS